MNMYKKYIDKNASGVEAKQIRRDFFIEMKYEIHVPPCSKTAWVEQGRALNPCTCQTLRCISEEGQWDRTFTYNDALRMRFYDLGLVRLMISWR